MITVTEWEKIGDSEHSYSATANTRNAAIKTLDALRDRDAELVNEVLGQDVATVGMQQFTKADIEKFVVDFLPSFDSHENSVYVRDEEGRSVPYYLDGPTEDASECMELLRQALSSRLSVFLGIKEAE
jgi:hypothetical protein